MIPRAIAELIAGYASRLELLSWIDATKLSRPSLYANPNAYLAGDLNLKNITYMERSNLARNPAAAELIKSDPSISDHTEVWMNAAMLDWLLKNKRYELEAYRSSFAALCFNANPQAVSMIIGRILDENEKGERKRRYSMMISSNPSAITYLREHPDKIDNGHICANPEAIDIIQGLEVIDFDQLSYNSHPWAIEQLRLNPDKINWFNFPANPGIYEPRIDTGIVDIIMSI
jgi:hypothetical protein